MLKTKVSMPLRRDCTFNIVPIVQSMARGLLFSVGFVPLVVCFLSVAAAAHSEFRLTQSISIGAGVFRGDRDAFMRYEDGNVPSLNPEIKLDGRLHVRTRLSSDLHIRLQTTIPVQATTFSDAGAGLSGDGNKTTFGIGWRRWDAEYGDHSFRFDAAGLPYTKAGVGLRLRYGQPDAGSGLRLIVARSGTRGGEALIRGDDTFGPFFLGQKRIVPASDVVLVDGERLQRGERPGDGHYYIDYDGGFIYFHTVLLAHETAFVTYDYALDDAALASEFAGVVAAHAFGETTVHAFALRDHAPVEDGPNPRQPGSTLVAYGANVHTTLPSGARLKSSVVATEKSPLLGLQSANLLEYSGERGRGSTWLNVVAGDFVAGNVGVATNAYTSHTARIGITIQF